ncbi:protein O-GlcNAcase [Rhagoletis pomonella]|uniref:protein O-GlcNAcase n=1 Tax=Rhagoletis pomonella TaxID=28610 RepID=UPI00177D10C0|nr:protein O-GlcNAcase [Rhagoletis pomonella]
MEESPNVEAEETMSEEKQPDVSSSANSTKLKRERKERGFICGVIEGFYGRPWTTEQRKDLFRKLKKWGMDSYVYAPKDDYKHRAYWRELYTVEEADHLTSLITAAREHDVMFYYALSPGLDMSYSSQKEIQTLKRKLDQVSQFGCEAFALLFDDIDSELSKVDKEAFQTFANAQVSVTNEIYAHLGNPRFLFCPTQYCSSRAMPTIHDSEYLNTLGSKLNHDIDIMWTGNKVISKIISLESIQEITEVLRRPPVIWDNLHANDYDQKRVFLGPYSGRSPELIPHLRGVMTNPNCEFHANTIAIHTLANWSKCSLDSKVNSSVSADIKLETENEDGTTEEELPVDSLSKNMYHPRIALKNAIDEWLPEFFLEKEAWGPITKPQPQVTMVMPIIPILPSINTCMSLTTTTTTSTSTKTLTVPEVNTTQLQALADVCSTVSSSVINPIANPVMNSLVLPTKVVTNDDIVNPIPTCVASNIELPKKIPISIVAVPIMHRKAVEDILTKNTTEEAVKEQSSDSGIISAITISAPGTNESNSRASNAPTIVANNTVTDRGENVGEIAKEDEMTIEKAEQLSTQLPLLKRINEKKAVEVSKNEIGGIIMEKDVDLLVNTSAIPGESVTTTGSLPMIDEHTLSPLSAISAGGNEPMECSSSLASQASGKEDRKLVSEDVVMAEGVEEDDVCNGSMNELNNSMQVESSEGSPLSNADMKDYEEKTIPGVGSSSLITVEDLYLLCDLFYLPFEHGSRGFKLLNEFNWLKANAGVLLGNGKGIRKCSNADGAMSPKPEVAEWMQRAEAFSNHCNAVHELLKKIANCANKEICHDLFSYVWDIAGTLTLLNAFVKWLSLGHFPSNVQTYTQGTYTWFSKGWKEAFMSGDQEPWVFRGGLIADLQRLMPVDSGNDLFLYKLPELPTSDYHLLRPYTPIDEAELGQVCTRAFLQVMLQQSDEKTDEYDNILETLLPSHLRELIADNIVGHFVTLNPNLCIVAHDASNAIVGYAAAALNANTFMRNVEVCWIPSMREKYAPSLLEKDNFIDIANGTDSEKRRESSGLNVLMIEMIRDFHKYEYDYQCPTEVSSAYPAVMTAAALKDALSRDQGLLKRLITVTLATLRSNGCFGVHVRLTVKGSENLQQHYSKIGFTKVYHDGENKYIYLGRRF